MITTEIIFWIFLIIVFYTYLGYGILVYILVKIKQFFVGKSEIMYQKNLPEVTLLIAAYNEESIIKGKMDNIQSINYPAGMLNVVWVTDGSTDGTNTLLKQFKDIKILFDPERKGKTAAINRAMKFINTPIVVFTDANTLINIEAIREIVAPFSNQLIGCVAGEKRIANKTKDNASSGGEGIYWKYESFLKRLDSDLYSAIGAAGELYAIRRELYENIEKDTLLDDFVLSMRVVEKGYRIAYCKKAFAIEYGSINIEEERKRKVRISAGGLQSIFKLLPLLNIFKYHIFTFQYFSHRVLRWTLTPVLLFLLFPMNFVLAYYLNSGLFFVLLIMQILFYILSLIGYLIEDKKIKFKIAFLPYYFVFMNFSVILGFVYLVKKGKEDGTWEKSIRKEK